MITAEAVKPYGQALKDFYEGDTGAELSLYRDDGEVSHLPLSVFFRESTAMPADKVALDNCRGRVLDVGAGTGLHSLYLQDKGFSVCALDISPEACDIMRKRGLKDVYCGQISELQAEPFDTLLILGRSIGLVEDLDGLDFFLTDVHRLVRPGGQIVLNSLDVSCTDDPLHLAYHESRRRAGRYIGEIEMCLEYKDIKGPLTRYLHVDPVTLAEHAVVAGWSCDILFEEDNGGYLARLVKKE